MHPKTRRASRTRRRGANLPEHRLALTLHESFRQSSDVMFYCDREGVILDINPAFTKVYGFTRGEAVGRNPRILRSRHSTREMYERMWSQIKSTGHWRGQLINRAKDGREIPVILSITSVKDARGEILGYVSNAVDVSEHLAMQARLAQSEALARLGEMAAVVAHEIRNPLGSIVMAAKQLAAEGLAEEDREVVFRVLREESQRLNRTLTSFLAFARPPEISLSRGDLNALVEETCRMLESDLDLLGEIRLELVLDHGLEPFPMDRDQMRQVTWNILLNAVQAMEGRGVLRVWTGRREGEAFFRVTDTGPGIPATFLEKLFKPFSTTKGQGTGLGLAVAERVVKAHGGRVAVDSAPGSGATFTVFLPAVQG